MKKAKEYPKTYQGEDILCKLPQDSSKILHNSKGIPHAPITAKTELCKPSLGTHIALPKTYTMARTPLGAGDPKTEARGIISNAPSIPENNWKEFPDQFQLEIFRLRRRVEELECTIRDRDERNVRAIAMLEDEAQFWRTYLNDHVSETFDGIRRRVLRIESTLMRLKEKGSKFYPPLELPAGWKKTNEER